MRIIGICFLAVLLAGCTTSDQNVSSSPQSVAMSPVTVQMSPTYKVPAKAQSLGRFTGLSCQKTALDSQPTEQDALQSLGLLAGQQGANIVANVSVDHAATIANCRTSITATGTAYRVP
ncbi:hypothetical protein KHC28_02885 [Ancylobacter sonchi]|uniref:hypothetical protein n=1 Tax=Ancylobacter sonchi TaxID=1937790 RepID=UPI001BD687B0|nr:hypothetical protein [Ancylobacter sonchi]MBS7532600.1 hypothetical protein [Ancylobacter sonchi]